MPRSERRRSLRCVSVDMGGGARESGGAVAGGGLRSAAGPHAFGAFQAAAGTCSERESLADGWKVLRRSTVELRECLQSMDPQRAFSSAPRRILTSDARCTTHGGWDNALHHAIVAVGDMVRTGPGDDACIYQVTDSLGSGTFASVYSCVRVDGRGQDGEPCAGGELRPGALKIMRNSPAYAMQALQELRILRLLNDQHDPDDAHHIVRIHRAFTYRHHICFVFEPLGCSLLDLIAGSGYRGLPLQHVRPLLADLLDAMEVLAAANVVHADVKPENVLLVPDSGPTGTAGLHLKLIDFGSAVITTEQGEDAKPSHYHQSRFYRAPEVLVGAAQHSMEPAIDLWSCGCIAAELYLGLPIFPGVNEYEQLFRIQEIVGNPPDDVLRRSARTGTFFDNIVVRSTQRQTFQLKSPEAFGSREADVERYFADRDLFSLINNHSEIVPSDMRNLDAAQHRPDVLSASDLDDNCLADEACSAKGINEESLSHTDEDVKQLEALWVKAFAHFICGLVDADPRRRWTASQVLSHPFVTGVDLATAMIWHPDQTRSASGVGTSESAAASAAIAIDGGGTTKERREERMLAKSTSPRRETALDTGLLSGCTQTVPRSRHGSDGTAAQPNEARVPVGDDRVAMLSSSAPSQSYVPAAMSTPSPWFGGGLKPANGFSPQQPVTPTMGSATSAMAAANMTNSAADAMRRVAAIDKAESRRWKGQPAPRVAAGAAYTVLKQLRDGALAVGQSNTPSTTSSGCGDFSRGYEPGFREMLRRIESRRMASTTY